MNLVEEVLRRAQRDFAELGVEWALIGGLAVSARAETRFTRDVDVAVAVEHDQQAETLVRQLTARGYAVQTIIDHEVTGRLATVRLTAPIDGSTFVDLLFASSGVEGELVAGAEDVELTPDLVIPVAGVPGLIVTKLLARDDVTRAQDAGDLIGLRAVASPGHLVEAKRLAVLVTERGYHRDRDLVAAVMALAPPEGLSPPDG